ncbi:MAG TPA: YbaB/EbfC family nucleoid-associated protein [Chloroflexota bacterium]|nr:YbaB/EbfC family nucleoid-associated protein [Chloroflexota bacterium]
MSKRSFSRRSSTAKKSGSKPKTNNPNAMLAQVQQMQAEMAVAQANLENEFITVTAGGGAISIVISGHQRVQSIQIDPDLLQPSEVEMLQDMLTAAVNSAIEQSQAMSAQKMEGITGGLGGGIEDLLGGLGLG